jgi:hypothetical protein
MARSSDSDRQIGGRARLVKEDGLAVVHRDELVIAAAGSEAQAITVADDARSVIHYHFPVEIEVRHVGAAVDIDKALASAFEELASHLENVS